MANTNMHNLSKSCSMRKKWGFSLNVSFVFLSLPIKVNFKRDTNYLYYFKLFFLRITDVKVDWHYEKDKSIWFFVWLIN